MIETNFAEILGLSKYLFQKMKSDPLKRVYILKKGEVNEELKVKIIKELRERGYSNKSITYMEFLSLYNPYRTIFSENEFAKILSVDYSLFQKGIDSSKKTTILRTEKVNDEFQSSIIANLNGNGYSNKKIDYAEFLELFEIYKNDMTELEFAKILEITPNTYYKLKLNKTKAVILKRKEPPQDIKEKIQNDLRKAGYLSKIINYQEFLTLYENYKLYITEKEFAVILNITEGAYRSIKYSKGRTVILKELQQLTINTNEIRKKILEEGYLNKLITYDEFLKLYNPYKNELKEQEFASILDISLYAYKGLKKGSKAKILKFNEISEKLKEDIKITLIELGYLNKIIDFNKFLELYRPYRKYMTDIQFAGILGISFNGLNNLKKSYKNNVVILKPDKVAEDKIENIKKIFIDKKYVNKRISYQEFLQLYAPYKNEMSELQFATILQISYNSLGNIKRNSNKTTNILPTNEIETDRKQEIYNNMKNNYTGVEIDLDDFEKMYEPYQNEMTKREFSKILEISQTRYDALRNFGKRIKIFESTYEEIRKKIIDDVKNYGKETITKDEFLKLYESYKKNVSQNQLANILGIYIYGDGQKYKINLKKQGIGRVKYLLSFESRKYSKSELDKMCKENEITLYDLLEDIYKPYLNKHKYKSEIYIGKCMIPREFQKKYSEKLLNIANLESKRYARLFNQYSNYEDIASEALMYVLYNKGDIVLNTSNDNEALEKIAAYLNSCIKYKYLLASHVNKSISLDEDVNGKTKRKRYELIRSKPLCIEQESYDSCDSIIQEMQSLYDNGLNNTETIDFIIKKYRLKKEELLDMLKKELLQRRTIKQDYNGNFYLGEEI